MMLQLWLWSWRSLENIFGFQILKIKKNLLLPVLSKGQCQIITELVRPFETFVEKWSVSHAMQTSRVSEIHYIYLHMYQY